MIRENCKPSSNQTQGEIEVVQNHKVTNANISVRSSSQKSTVGEFSTANIFEISVQQLMPMVMKIKEENQQLHEFKEKLSEEMTELEEITAHLLKENQELRSHYNNRTADIKKVTDTMTINMNQDYSDSKHLIQMFRNWNCSMVRNIEKVLEEKHQTQHSIELIQKRLIDLQEHNIKSEETMLERKIKVKQIQNKVIELENKREKLFKKTTTSLEDDIDQLILDVSVKKQQNIKGIKTTRKMKNQVEIEKPQKTRQNVEIIKNLKTLSAQLNHIKEAIVKQKMKIQQYEIKKGQSQAKFKKAEIDLQKKTSIYSLQSKKTEIISQQHGHVKLSLKKLKQKKQQVQYEHSKLEKQIKMKKTKMQEKKSTHEQKKHELDQEKRKIIFRLKKQIENLEEEQKEKDNQTDVEMKQLTSNSTYLQEYHNNLMQEIYKLERKVDSMNNPIKQIIALEYKLKKQSH